jgi:hypothetical protein
MNIEKTVIASYATRGNARRIRVILEDDETYSYAEFSGLDMIGHGTFYPTRAAVMDAVETLRDDAYAIDGITFRRVG